MLRRPVESAQYSRDANDRTEKPLRTGSPAFAGDDSMCGAALFTPLAMALP